MCAWYIDEIKSISNTTEVKKASSLKKLHCAPPAVLNVGEIIAGGSSQGRVLSDQERYACLKNHFVPDQNYARLTTQTLTKDKRKQTYTLNFQTSWFKKYPWLVFSPSQKGGGSLQILYSFPTPN